MEWYGVFAWHEDPVYHARDVMGSKLYRREAAAQKAADKHNAELLADNPCFSRGFVVRRYFHTDGVIISEKGAVRLAEDHKPALASSVVDVGAITEYGLTQKLSQNVRVF